jgi:uncharacterized membrane protein YgcG
MRAIRIALLVVAAVAAALAVAATALRHDSAPKRPPAPAASQKVGDSADVMRRLQRKNLVQRDR